MARRRNISDDAANPPPELPADENPDNSNAAALAELDAAAVASEDSEPAENSMQDERPARPVSRPRRRPARALAPIFQSLVDAALLDARQIELLAALDPETTRIVLHQLDGLDDARSSARPIPLANFAPDFLSQILAHVPAERVKVEVRELDAEPWYFCLILPAREVEKRTAAASAPTPTPAPVITPAPAAPIIQAPPPGVDPSMFLIMNMMQQFQQQQQATMAQFMAVTREDMARRNSETVALLERLAAPRPKTELEQTLETGAHEMIKRAVNVGLAKVAEQPPDPMDFVDKSIEQISKLSNLHVKMQDATDRFAESSGTAQPADAMDKLMGFVETPTGQSIVAKILGGRQAATDAPALPSPADTDAQERLAAYG